MEHWSGGNTIITMFLWALVCSSCGYWTSEDFRVSFTSKKTKIGVLFKSWLHLLFAGSENSNSHSAAFGQRHDVGSNADAFPSASPHTDAKVRWRCKYGVSAWMTGVAVVLVVLVVWRGTFGVTVESNYIKIKSFIARLVKIYSFQLWLKRGDQKVIFRVFCHGKKAPKKRIEHKDNPAGRCCSAGLPVDSVEAHSQLPLAAGRLDGCQA